MELTKSFKNTMRNALRFIYAYDKTKRLKLVDKAKLAKTLMKYGAFLQTINVRASLSETPAFPQACQAGDTIEWTHRMRFDFDGIDPKAQLGADHELGKAIEDMQVITRAEAEEIFNAGGRYRLEEAYRTMQPIEKQLEMTSAEKPFEALWEEFDKRP